MIKIKKLHYVFLPSQSNPKKDPLVLWLNGGPGCSSLLGFIQEHGPLVIPDFTREFKENEYSWNKLSNMIYLESPAGVGFSYTDNGPEDLNSSDYKSAVDNLAALKSFFVKFPEYKQNDFYITGESYAGIYVPYLAQKVLVDNIGKVDIINIKGILVGNGCADWEVDVEKALIDFAYYHGLYSEQTREKIVSFCNMPPEINENFDKEKCNAARKEVQDNMQGLNIYDIYRYCPPNKTNGTNTTTKYDIDYDLFKKAAYYQKSKYMAAKFRNLIFNPPDEQALWPSSCGPDEYPSEWFNTESVKTALNVRTNITFEQCSDAVSKRYATDFEKGSLYLYPQLIQSNLKIWFFSGDIDGAVPFNGSQKWIKKLNLTIVDNYRSWKVDNQVAGFAQVYSGLTFLTVRGAGHMVPQWKRKESFVMFKAYLDGSVRPN